MVIAGKHLIELVEIFLMLRLSEREIEIVCDKACPQGGVSADARRDVSLTTHNHVERRELRDRLALELSSLAQHSTHAERRNTVQNVAAYWQGLRRCKGAPTYTKEEIWRLVAPQIPWPEILSRTTSESWNVVQLDPKRNAAVTP